VSSGILENASCSHFIQFVVPGDRDDEVSQAVDVVARAIANKGKVDAGLLRTESEGSE